MPPDTLTMEVSGLMTTPSGVRDFPPPQENMYMAPEGTKHQVSDLIREVPIHENVAPIFMISEKLTHRYDLSLFEVHANCPVVKMEENELEIPPVPPPMENQITKYAASAA